MGTDGSKGIGLAIVKSLVKESVSYIGIHDGRNKDAAKCDI
ncbi:3-ketoacyl-ACP/CoA reductase (fragment) [Xenorhabdus poinarii G6]|uniref:3-ketoacyl-ACP/CoA reductase n=1 Tax=Xenorhabdus poinarii G6 TaxID=1354304 RepID=A0A068R2R6_9GAMM